MNNQYNLVGNKLHV